MTNRDAPPAAHDPSTLDLEAIEARANATTPGPWEIVDDEFEGEQWLWIEKSTTETICGFADPDTGVTDAHRANAAFIAAARTDIPTLIAAVRALQAQLTTTQRWSHRWHTMARGLHKQFAEESAQVQRRFRQYDAACAAADAQIEAVRHEVTQYRETWMTHNVYLPDEDRGAWDECDGCETAGPRPLEHAPDCILPWLDGVLALVSHATPPREETNNV